MDGLWGFIANGLGTILTHPIDVIKTNYQLDRTKDKRSIRECVRKIWKTRGVRGFYAGVTPNLSTTPIFWSVYFGTNQAMGGIEGWENSYGGKFAKSYMSSLIGSTITNPLFVIKTRMQDSNARGMSIGKTIRGLNGLGYGIYLRGLGSSYLNNVKLAIQFPLYDAIKESTGSVIVSSLMAKTISSSIAYPLDLIRVVQRSTDVGGSIREITRRIYDREGIRGMYRGVLLYNAVTTPNFMIMMIGYETLKRISS